VLHACLGEARRHALRPHPANESCRRAVRMISSAGGRLHLMTAMLWLPLVAKALATALIVVTASTAAEALGPVWGAIVCQPAGLGRASLCIPGHAARAGFRRRQCTQQCRREWRDRAVPHDLWNSGQKHAAMAQSRRRSGRLAGGKCGDPTSHLDTGLGRRVEHCHLWPWSGLREQVRDRKPETSAAVTTPMVRPASPRGFGRRLRVNCGHGQHCARSCRNRNRGRVSG
jgi:hypothetical protein